MEQTNLRGKRKKTIILVTTLILFIGVSFAFIAAQLSGGAIGNANVTADTTDNLQFNVDKDIYLNPTQFNVVEGGSGLSDTAVGTASLIANSTNNDASATYNVYFKINTNEYIYTTEDNKPEMILTITDPSGIPITSVDGLTYVTAQNADGSEVSGFDITTEMGLFTIASDYAITSTSSTQATEQDWIFTVTFINLTTDQFDNINKVLNAEIKLQIDKIETFATYIKGLYTRDGENGLYLHDSDMDYGSLIGETFTDRYIISDYASNSGIEKIDDELITFYCDNVKQNVGSDCNSEDQFYQIGDNSKLKFSTYESCLNMLINNGYVVDTQKISAHDNSLRYAGGDYILSDEYVDLYSYVYDTYDENADTSGVIKFYCNSDPQSSYVGLPCEDGYYYLDYDENTHYTIKDDAVNKAVEDGYIIPFVKNYVCFGSDEEICPLDDLYRIIGVFDGQVKLVKADLPTLTMLGTNGDYITTYADFSDDYSFYNGNISFENAAVYYWNGTNYNLAFEEVGAGNVWSYSELNKINLNTNYINYLNSKDTKWANMIDNSTWYLGGHDNYGASITPGVLIDFEHSSYRFGFGPATYQAKIGLMYVSDYAYASDPILWKNLLVYYTLNEDLNGYENASNWLSLGVYEWFITPSVYHGSYAYYLNSMSTVGGGGTVGGDYSLYAAARPTFYLKNIVKLKSGDGTFSNPYRVYMD